MMKHHAPASTSKFGSTIDMDTVGSELNLFEPFINQTAVIEGIVQEFAPLATFNEGRRSTSK